jgi:hypothetical protein
MKDLIVLPGLEKRLLVAEEPELVEEIFEPRLQRLGRLVKDLAGSAYPLLVIETARIRQGLGELVVKEEAMRWILRMAKDCEGPVRRKLLAHAADALSDLERIAESLLYAECT